MPRPELLAVVVISSDATFRRLAGAALTRAGYQVHTAAATPRRLDRIVKLRRPEVVVLDVPSNTEPLSLQSSAVDRPAPAFVMVGDETSSGLLDKWGPLEILLSAVQSAIKERPRLHLVSSD